jgi:hypothetical protein
MTGGARKPGCMAKRRSSPTGKRPELSYARQRHEHDAAAVRRAQQRMQRDADRRTAGALGELQSRWGGRDQAIAHLRGLARSLDELRLQESTLVAERDELVQLLRNSGGSWDSLVAVTGLSRQALSKRMAPRTARHDIPRPPRTKHCGALRDRVKGAAALHRAATRSALDTASESAILLCRGGRGELGERATAGSPSYSRQS